MAKGTVVGSAAHAGGGGASAAPRAERFSQEEPLDLGLVCPLDFRYGRPEAKKVFAEESKLRLLLEVEAALARAHASIGRIPGDAALTITKKVASGEVRLARVKSIEREIQHDLMSVVKALSEVCGDAGKYVHLGATSYDIIDTANALQMKEAFGLLREQLVRLKGAFLKLARTHRETVMLGRTHGQAASPITFGLKMAVFAAETQRQVDRIDDTLPRIAVGKLSGPVGTGGGLGKEALDLQRTVMDELDLGVEEASTQIVQRDRYVEAIGLLANIATSMDRFATEVRNLQRTEIHEVEEPFDVGKQVGSSSMPHKRNPKDSEQVSGLARLVRANVAPMMESAVQWHERDLANSAAERFLLPHSFLLTDHIVAKMATVFEGLVVYPERMKANLEATKGLVFTEAIVGRLVDKGLGRQEAHELLRSAAMRALERNVHLKSVLGDERAVTSRLSAHDLDAAFEPRGHIGVAPLIVDEIVNRLSRLS